MSELYEFYTERRRKHYHQRHQLLREGAYLKDPSCTECYPLIFEPKTYFKNFWKWYKNITPAETYSLYTVRQLEELVTDTIGIIEVETTGIQKKLEMIIGSITYNEYTLRIFKDLLGLEIGNDYRNNGRDIAASYLRENAAEWYETDRGNIAQWHTDAQNDNFRERFKDYFSSQLKQIQWQVELTNIKQGIGENIEDYSRRFKKIM